MHDGVAWLAREDLTWLGYYVTLARGVEPEELVRRLAGDESPVELGDHSADELGPREQVLHQAVPAALIKGQLPA